MEQMIDIHCHILPGVDDGSENMDQSIRMLQIAAKEGIGTMIATPHYHLGRKVASFDEIELAFRNLQAAVAEHQIPIDIQLGNEIFYSHEAIALLKRQKAHTMCGTRYVLLEFHPTHSYQDIRHGVNELLQESFIPIIAHVERYHTMVEHPERVDELIDMGAYIQINAADLMGDAGFKLKKYCKRLLKNGQVHFIASDAHSDQSRAPRLQKCMSYVARKYGQDYAADLFVENAKLVMADTYI